MIGLLWRQQVKPNGLRVEDRHRKDLKPKNSRGVFGYQTQHFKSSFCEKNATKQKIIILSGHIQTPPPPPTYVVGGGGWGQMERTIDKATATD